MASGSISFQTYGMRESLKKYGKRLSAAQDLTPAWHKIDKGLITPMLRRQYASKGAYGGQAWAPLRPSTQRARQRPGGNRGGIGHPLWDFGRLKASVENVGPESIRVVRPRLYQRGTRVPYAHLHQKGFVVTEWGGRKFKRPRSVPAREIIPDPMPSRTAATAVKLVAAHITVV